MCVPGRICPTGEEGGAEEKTEAGLLGRWAGLGSKQKWSHWGGGCDWRESRGGVTLDLGAAGERAEEELLGRSERIGGKHMRSPYQNIGFCLGCYHLESTACEGLEIVS